MNEAEAERELNRLAALLNGAAVTAGVVTRVLEESTEIAKAFPASDRVAQRRDAINKKASLLTPRPEASRRIRALEGHLATRQTVPALRVALHESRAGEARPAP